MKRSKLKKQSKQSISKIQRLIWEEVKRIVRKKYSPCCYTCSQTGLTGSNFHCGHLWPKATLGAYLKYDLRVIRPQCFRCNIHLGGQGAIFYRMIRLEIGSEAMEQLEFERNNVIVKAYDHYEKIFREYKAM